MTSLCPGTLFCTPGLNHYSTPSSRTDTPTEIHSRFSRVPFNGIPWPKPSPVSKVYDVRNSSTRMILLNNKYSKKGCRLRGQTLNDGDVKSPDPERHSAETPYVNRKSHIDCANSSSPVFKPEVKTNMKWANSTQRPPIKFEDGSSVNYKRHTTCMVSDDIRRMNWHRPRRPYSTSIIRESMRSRSPLLDDLNPGERLYMFSIARVYSVDSMRKLKQSQYAHLLHREIERGMYSPEECEKYWKYLSSPRKTQQGPNDTFQRRRIRSAPAHRQEGKETHRQEGKDSDWPQSRKTPGQHSTTSQPVSTRSKSRSSSRPISRASVISTKSHKTKPQEKTTPTTKSDKKKPKSDKSVSRHQNDESPEDKQTVTNVPVEDDHNDDDDSQNEAQVRGEDDKAKDSPKSDEDERRPIRGTKHREGGDRPKSRLGGRKRNMDNSDDDYSTDSSSSSSDESDTDRTRSMSKSTSEPTKSSKSSRSASQETGKKSEKTQETTVPDLMAAPPTGDKHNTSYSEDFTETSASESAKGKSDAKSEDAKGGKSDDAKVGKSEDAKRGKSEDAKGGKSDDAKQDSDNSMSDTTTQSDTVNQSKTTSSEETATKAEKPATQSDTSTSQSTSAQKTSTYESTNTSSALKPPAQAGMSSSDTENATETSTSEDISKSSSGPPKIKVSDAEVKVSEEEIRAGDESYSDDFTKSTSHEDDKPKENSESRDGEEDILTKNQSGSQETDPKCSKDVKHSEGAPHNSQRRDSIELNEERVRDWDKIEY